MKENSQLIERLLLHHRDGLEYLLDHDQEFVQKIKADGLDYVPTQWDITSLQLTRLELAYVNAEITRRRLEWIILSPAPTDDAL